MREKKLSIKEICFIFVTVMGLCAVTVCIGISMKKAGSNFDVSSKEYKEIRSAYDNFKNYTDTYMIASVMELPENSVCYMEIVSDTGSFTEYPIDDYGNIGVIDFSNTNAETQYMLYDYMTSDRELYQISGVSDSGDYSWVHMPKSYAEDISSRELMFFDRYIDKMSNITNEGKKVLNAQTGEEFTTYTATVPASVVRDVCGIDTLGLYEHVSEDYKSNKSVNDLMTYYLDNLDMSMTFSNGKLTIGVSKDNILSYVRLEAGGLGNIMCYTKQLITGDNAVSRDVPDISNAKEYIDEISDLADYVSSFDSYEDAMNALYSPSDTVTEAVESTTESVEESTSNTAESIEESTSNTAESIEESTEIVESSVEEGTSSVIEN